MKGLFSAPRVVSLQLLVALLVILTGCESAAASEPAALQPPTSFAAPVTGGWAVVTLDHLPSQLIFNQPATMGFSVRQHGETLLGGLQPTISATRERSNDTVTATAHGEGPTGHYVATLMFPMAGTWQWYIDAFGSRQPMPPLNVTVSQSDSRNLPVESRAVNATATWNQQMFLTGGFAGVVALVVLVIFWRRRQLRWWLVPLAIGVAFGAASMAVVDRLPRPAASAASESVNSDDAAREGRDLFLAKGCIVCHQNRRVQFSQDGFVQVKSGPDLTNRKVTSEFLHIWLKDPSKVKPGTAMPALDLNDQEIDALAAFLAAGGKSE